jgi:hypothetical protein
MNEITTKDIRELKTLMNEINNLLNRIAPEKNNRFNAYSPNSNKIQTEYINGSLVCNMLNIDMQRLSSLLENEILEYRTNREGVTEIKRDSVLRYINEDRENDL